jgi:hypothetical protein
MESVLPTDSRVADEKAKREVTFCEEYVRTGDAVTAVIRAGIRATNFPVEIVARNLLNRPDIQIVIATLERHGGANDAPVEITRESVIADAQNVFEEAMRAGRFESAIGAKRLQSALLGFLVERKEITLIKGASEMTNDELRRIAYKGKVVDGYVEEEKN